MKILSRDFTLREKISIVVLLIILTVIGYKYFVDTPVKAALASAQAEKDYLQSDLMVTNLKIKNLEKMEAELEQILNDPTISSMPSYNGVKQELAFLNETLAMSYSYSINVADVTRQEDQIRRDVAIQFTTADYDSMKKIIKTIAENTDRTLISNISIKADKGYACDLYLTFYETMVGGTADSGLPTE